MMNYREYLQMLNSWPQPEKQRRISALVSTSPLGYWPDGMPASIDPKLVLIGVSPGNSPMSEEDVIPGNADYFESDPCVIKSENNHFYYRDSSNYWAKLRYLANSFFAAHDPGITENESISLTTHFNLGTGSAGQATKKDIEEKIVQWVSCVLNSTHNPDLVVFGLYSILTDRDISKWWNHEQGLKIDWNMPNKETKFAGHITRNYKFREWDAINAKEHQIRLVMWPNDPSRAPFTNPSIWRQSVSEYISMYADLA